MQYSSVDQEDYITPSGGLLIGWNIHDQIITILDKMTNK